MSNSNLTPELLANAQNALNLKTLGLNNSEIATKLNIPLSTARGWIKISEREGMIPDTDEKNAFNVRKLKLEDEIRDLRTKLIAAQRDTITTQAILSIIHKISEYENKSPNWTLKPHNMRDMGVPILFLSDLHWGEVVNPLEINHSNEYNIKIAKRRLHMCIERATGLIQSYPGYNKNKGMVLLLGGDMISGDIHEELRDTNEFSSIETILDLSDDLIHIIKELHKNVTNKIHIAGVVGNHSRTSIKPRAKRQATTNFDWLLYHMVYRAVRHLEDITF